MPEEPVPEGERAIHAAIADVCMARAYHEERHPAVHAHLMAAFEDLLDALGEFRRPGSLAGRVTLRIDAELLAAIDALVAHRIYPDRSSVVRSALHSFLSYQATAKQPVKP